MIIISPLETVSDVVREHPDAFVCGLLGPGMAHPDLPVAAPRRLRLTFHDVREDHGGGMVPPEMRHVRELIAFVARWRDTAERPPLIVHCWAGISRSPAAAFIAACMLHPRREEAHLAAELRALAPDVTPNIRMVRLADALLGRAGRMEAAMLAIGRGAETSWGRVRRWKCGSRAQPPMRPWAKSQ